MVDYPDVVDPGVRILYASQTTIDARWNSPLRSPFWRLYGNDADGCEILTPRGSCLIPAERLCLVPAWGEFRGRCRRRVGHAYVHFSPSGAWRDGAAALGDLGLALAQPVVLPAMAGTLSRLRAACQQWDGSFLGRLELAGLILDLLAWLVRNVNDAARVVLATDHSGDPVQRAAAILDGRSGEHIAFAQIAAEVGLSPAHLARRFKDQLGQTPERYRQTRRVAQAAERLLASTEPIERIAEACGFANRHHFTRVFTAQMGVAPAAWRRRHLTS